MRKFTQEARAEAIYNLRRNIREQFVDIRANGQVTKALWKLVNEQLAQGQTLARNSHLPSQKKAKRKRKARDDSDVETEDEYRPEPIRSLGRGPRTRIQTGAML